MDRARTRCLDPIDSIGQLLSITVGRNTLAEGILYQITEQGVELYKEESTMVSSINIVSSTLDRGRNANQTKQKKTLVL